MNPNPLSIGKYYCLRLPDGRPLGHVHVQRFEDGWAEGPFTAAPAFAEYRELFDRADQLARDQMIPQWEAAADEIEALHIQVVEENGVGGHGGFRIYVVGDQASIGAPLCVS